MSILRDKFHYFGLFASFVYILTVILGGVLWSGYSHRTQAISELAIPTSPNYILIQSLFSFYNILLLIFALGLYTWQKQRFVKIASISLMLCSIAGLLMIVFPQDPVGKSLTFSGQMHLILAGISAFTTLLTLFSFGFGLSKLKKYPFLSKASFIFGLIILIFGPITAIGVTNFPDIFGVLERITIGAFIFWLLFVSIFL